MQQLLIRADDLGSFSGVTPAVLHARTSGIVRNASVMVPTPWFAATAVHLRGRTDLCLGVHLTVCCEWNHLAWQPVAGAAAVPSLVDANGNFKANPGIIHQDGINVDEVLRECTAQLERARAYGLPISYVDTHMGWEWIHALSGGPRLAELLPEWCRKHGVRWYNHATLQRLPLTDVQNLATNLLHALDRSGPGTFLIVTHPCWPSQAIGDAQLSEAPGQVQRQRALDAAFLADPRLAAALAKRGVRLVRYDEVIAPPTHTVA